MKKTFLLLIFAGALAGLAWAQPVISGVLNAVSYSAVVSPGSWVTIFGANLAPASLSAQTLPLPTTLAGVSVTVAGLPASLLYVSPNQINALIPSEVEPNADSIATVQVDSPGGSSGYNIRLLTKPAPAIFTRNGTGTGRALLFNPNFQPVDTITAQGIVVLYATGLTLPYVRGGCLFDDSGDDEIAHILDNFGEVYIGERKARVLSACTAPEFPGIYQLKVMAPAPVTDRLYIRSRGQQSNIAEIGIQGGANTANVKGTIDGLYPSSDPFFTLPPCVGDDPPDPCSAGESLSVMLHAGTFNVSFDIVPSAGPFAIAAVGEGGSSIISVDPAAGAYTAAATTITPAAAQGDFSTSIVPLWDYLSCDLRAVCFPFPDSRVPLSRISPFWARATRLLPAPNATAPGWGILDIDWAQGETTSPNASVQVAGSLSASRFVIDDQNNSSLSTFGGIIRVPYGPFDRRVSTFKLYVDGKLVASKDVPYGVPHR